MRLSTIVVCLLLLAPTRSLSCFEYTSEATPELSTPHRSGIEASAGEASAERLRMAGAGVATMGLIVVVARGFRRATNHAFDEVLPSRFRLDAGLDRGELGPKLRGHPRGYDDPPLRSRVVAERSMTTDDELLATDDSIQDPP